MKNVIYKIQNTKTRKVYIGSAVSFQHRILTHLKQLKDNKHSNVLLQRAWNKYGKNAFMFKILEVTQKGKLLVREQYWMDKFESYNSKYGYNINSTAGSNLGRIWDLKQEEK